MFRKMIIAAVGALGLAFAAGCEREEGRGPGGTSQPENRPAAPQTTPESRPPSETPRPEEAPKDRPEDQPQGQPPQGQETPRG